MSNPISQSPAAPARHRRLLKWAVILIILMALALAAAKGFASWLLADTERLPPQVQIRNQTRLLLADRSTNVIPDPEVGFMLPANLDQQVATLDFEFRRITDEHGFVNSGDWPEQVDIVFLGDSLIMAEGVGVANGFTARVDAALPGVSTLNLGSPGAGLERQINIYERFASGMNPKLVVACYYVAADFYDDRQFREWLDNPGEHDFNTFRMRYERRLAKEAGSQRLRRLQKHVLYEWLLSIIEPRLASPERVPHKTTLPDGSVMMLNRKTVKFAMESFTRNDERLLAFADSVERLGSLVESSGANMLVVLIPSKEELFAGVMGGDSAVELTKQTLADLGVPVVDLYPKLRQSANDEAPFFPRDPHLNAYGNRVIADDIVRALHDSGFSPSAEAQ